MRPAIFLDRDGVLNKAIVKNGKPYPPASLNELAIPGDVPITLQKLSKNNFLLICVTNQPDVARGKTEFCLVESINAHLMKSLGLNAIKVCYHDDKDHCECRKPLPGLLLEAAKQYDIDLSSSYMIGDRWKDIAAGIAAGCKTVWLDYNYDEDFKTTPPDFITTTCADAATWIINHHNRKII